MAISKTFQEIIRKANKANDYTTIQNELDRLEKNNFKTMVTTLYAVKLLVRPEWTARFTPTKEMITRLSQEFPEKPKFDEKVDGIILKQIVENRYADGWHSILTYQLLNTGRRTSELMFNQYEIQNGNFYIVIDKQKTKELQRVLEILDEDVESVDRDIKTIREQTNHIGSTVATNSIYRYITQKYSLNPHLLRSIYVAYIHAFKNPTGISQPSLVKSVTNHASSRSDSNYSNIALINAKPYLSKNMKYHKHTKSQLVDIVKGAGLRGWTGKTKQALIDML